MKKNLTNQTPCDGWTLDQLGTFAQQIAKRSAHDAWLLGRAFTLAKARAKAEGHKIEEWRKRWIPFLSQPTLSRYEAVANLPEEEVKGKGLTDVYRLLGLVREKPSTELPAEDKERPAPSTEPALSGGPDTTPTLKVVPGEPDSALRRIAAVVTLLQSLVNDLPALGIKAEEADSLDDAIHESITLLKKIRATVEHRAVA